MTLKWISNREWNWKWGIFAAKALHGFFITHLLRQMQFLALPCQAWLFKRVADDVRICQATEDFPPFPCGPRAP